MYTHAATVAAGESLVDARRSSHGRWFFAGLAGVAIIAVLVGFARTYFLKTIFPMRAFPLLFHIHGALFTTWLLFVALQTSLVASRRTALHRKLGWLGLALLVGVVVTGTLVSFAAARGEAPLGAAVRAGEIAWARNGITPVEQLFVNLTTMAFVGVTAGAGLIYRRRSDVHKRLMMLATIALLPAAIGRGLNTILGIGNPVLTFGSTGLFILAIAIHDRRRRGRVHPVTLWGGLALLLSFPARLMLAKTALWLNLATWLIQ